MSRLGPAIAIALLLSACGGNNEEPASAPEAVPHQGVHASQTSTVAVTKTESVVPKPNSSQEPSAMQAGVQQEGISAETSREVSEPASGEQRLDGTSGSAVTGEHSATSTGGGATAGETPSVPASSGPATKVSSAEKAGSETLAPPETIALLLAGDAHRGKRLAAKCLACHRLDDRRKVGPGLKGVVGRRAGKMPDMKYSKALAEAQWIWDEPKLAEWVCNSKQAIRKLSGDDSATTKMPAQRICDPRDQSDLIAFLKSI